MENCAYNPPEISAFVNGRQRDNCTAFPGGTASQFFCDVGPAKKEQHVKKESVIRGVSVKQLIRPMSMSIGRIFLVGIVSGKAPLCKESCQRS